MMKTRWIWGTLIGIGIASAAALAVYAQEKDEKGQKEGAGEEKVALDKVPAKAQEALKKLAGSAKITEVSKESEGGMDVFEAKWTIDGRLHEAAVAADGTLVDTEEQMDVKDVPEAVRKAAAAQFPGVAADKVTYTKAVKIIYEAEAKVDGKDREVKISPTGEVAKHEKGGEKKQEGKDEEKDEDDDD
jgi:hypothetical protein